MGIGSITLGSQTSTEATASERYNKLATKAEIEGLTDAERAEMASIKAQMDAEKGKPAASKAMSK